MRNLPALTKLKVQKAAPMIVAHVKELLAPLDLQASKQYTIKVKTKRDQTRGDEMSPHWR